MLDEVAEQLRPGPGPLNRPLLVLQERFKANFQFASVAFGALEEIG